MSPWCPEVLTFELALANLSDHFGSFLLFLAGSELKKFAGFRCQKTFMLTSSLLAIPIHDRDLQIFYSRWGDTPIIKLMILYPILAGLVPTLPASNIVRIEGR